MGDYLAIELELTPSQYHCISDQFDSDKKMTWVVSKLDADVVEVQ